MKSLGNPNKFLRHLSIWWVLLALPTPIFAAGLKGQISLKEGWAPMIYLSSIDEFDYLGAASYDFLIQQVAVDSTGKFNFPDLQLPEDDRIYRLHLCKTGDPVSTILIGGQDENFVHFIMNNSSEISINALSTGPIFSHCSIEGHPANNTFLRIFALERNLNIPSNPPSIKKRSLKRQNTLIELLKIAETDPSFINKLYSVYFINETFNFDEQLQLLKNVKGNLDSTAMTSPYYQSFEDQLHYLNYKDSPTQNPIYTWIKSAGLLLAMLLMILLIRKKVKDNANQKSEPQSPKRINELSIQEKKIFNLLVEGKSNKEISEEMHIEISTVKSHVHKIYTKLKVKSRKEVINTAWDA